jgi:folate-binding protein YgfZ
MASVDVSIAEREHRLLIDGCGLLDRSERGKLALAGTDAVEFLGGQVTNELSTLAPGDGCYAAFLTHKGKMLGDLRILAAGAQPDSPVDELLLDTERVALQALFDMIRRFQVGYRVQLHKRTVQSALLSLIGPHSRQILGRTTDSSGCPALAEHGHIASAIAGLAVRLIGTEDGVDVLCQAGDREVVWQALIAGGAQQVSESASEVLRVQRGHPRFGLDIDQSTIPQEAGLNERAVSFTKGCYVGQETVARLYYRGKTNRQLHGLRLSSAIASGESLQLEGRAVGTLGSSVLSPTFGPIGLALLRRDAEPGATLNVGEAGVTAQVVALPFAS